MANAKPQSKVRPNKLIETTSPYLLQHAYNPVEWYPWGEEALSRAKQENKLILLSIGYSTCYWCHVMEREVFENEAIAEIMNEHFINIKVDREERPDIDETYMVATQLITRQGGWPNNLFLTPNKNVFFAGTYFGPDDHPKRPGFPRVLKGISDAWKNDQSGVQESADNITEKVIEYLTETGEKPQALPPVSKIADHILGHLTESYDALDGGFYSQPKFPHETHLLFLLNSGNADGYEIAKDSIDKMLAGGIYDHVGGGFHRYAVDRQWRVPHFEKMLYNQALGLKALVALYKQQPSAYYEFIIKQTVEFVLREMTTEEGAFISAIDAETDAMEGAYYVWNNDELSNVLSGEQLKQFEQWFALEDIPEFAGHKHPDGKALYLKESVADWVKPFDSAKEEYESVLSALHEYRITRKYPHKDTKVIAAWNGMMIDALFEASEALDNKQYAAVATKVLDFILSQMHDDDGLKRIYAKETSHTAAFLDDYAWILCGMLRSIESKYNKYINKIIEEVNLKHNTGSGQFSFNAKGQEILSPLTLTNDGAVPSASAVLLDALIKAQEKNAADVASMLNDLSEYLTFRAAAAPSQYIHTVAQLLKIDLPEDSLDYVSAAESQEDFLDISAEVVSSDDNQHKIVVNIHIPDGWQVHSTEPKAAEFTPFSIRLAGNNADLELLKISYPEAKVITKPAEKSVYEGSIQVSAVVKAGKAFEELALMISYQACNDTLCKEPEKKIIKAQL